MQRLIPGLERTCGTTSGHIDHGQVVRKAFAQTDVVHRETAGPCATVAPTESEQERGLAIVGTEIREDRGPVVRRRNHEYRIPARAVRTYLHCGGVPTSQLGIERSSLQPHVRSPRQVDPAGRQRDIGHGTVARRRIVIGHDEVVPDRDVGDRKGPVRVRIGGSPHRPCRNEFTQAVTFRGLAFHQGADVPSGGDQPILEVSAEEAGLRFGSTLCLCERRDGQEQNKTGRA